MEDGGRKSEVKIQEHFRRNDLIKDRMKSY